MHDAPPIELAATDAAIAGAFDVLVQLRPMLRRGAFVATIRALMEAEGFCLAVLRERGRALAVAGFRVITMLYRGRILVVDDLVVDRTARSSGLGSSMLHWLDAEARRRRCVEMQLISRHERTDAHRFYRRQGFRSECMHFLREVRS